MLERPRSSPCQLPEPTDPPRDLNLEVAGVLGDLALVHPSRHGRFAYKRAAARLRALEEPVELLARQDRLREVPGIGPVIERVVREIVETGRSLRAESAIAESGRVAEVLEARARRQAFLSRAAVLEILRMPIQGVVRVEDYAGDLQTHSRSSDGADTPEAMAEAARARGHRFLALTDHSRGLPIAGGMSDEEVVAQHREIERLNPRWNGRFRLLKGVEANLDIEGGLDLTPDELSRFELVVASPHSRLRRAEDQTHRMLRALETGGVHVLGHPRGRMLNRRGVLADWDEVFSAAARSGVAIEIDGDPYRQDLDHELARRALLAGCWLALDSDAHSAEQLVYSECALAHARLAGVPAERVVNCWSLDRLLEWSRARQQ